MEVLIGQELKIQVKMSQLMLLTLVQYNNSQINQTSDKEVQMDNKEVLLTLLIKEEHHKEILPMDLMDPMDPIHHNHQEAYKL